MLEHAHRQADGSLLIGRNIINGERRVRTLPRACDLRPVTDAMARCHPPLEKGGGKLSLMDAENAWFVRINHINHYGIAPHLEKPTIHPPEPLLFLNVQGHPGTTSLITKTCPASALWNPPETVDHSRPRPTKLRRLLSLEVRRILQSKWELLQRTSGCFGFA
jgi:Domain of unknown function (DUF4914)